MTAQKQYQVKLEPNQNTPGEGKYSFGWISGTGGETAKNDSNWHGRSIVFKDLPITWVVWSRRFVGDVARCDNYHLSSFDPAGAGGVSPVAYGYHAGRPYDVQFEADSSSKQYPIIPRADILADRNEWFVARYRWGRGDGECDVWVLSKGKKVLELRGIKTHYAETTRLDLWDGGYNSSGVDRQQIGFFTMPGVGSTFQKAMDDRPVELNRWHSTGPNSSSSLTDFGTIERPDSELYALVAGSVPPPPVPTNEEYRDLADKAFRSTTVSYPVWQRKVANGDYADVKATQWYKGFSNLDKIK